MGARSKYTLEKVEYSSPAITKYVVDSLKDALVHNAKLDEDAVTDFARRVRFALSQCKSENEMIACGETILQDINILSK